MDARAGPAALEGEALGAGLAVRFRAVEGGAPRAGVAVLCLGGLAGGGVRVLAGRGVRRGILDVDRAAGASGHLCLSSNAPVLAVRGSCRVPTVVVLADHPGGHSGPAVWAGGSVSVGDSVRSGDPTNVTPVAKSSQARKHKL